MLGYNLKHLINKVEGQHKHFDEVLLQEMKKMMGKAILKAIVYGEEFRYLEIMKYETLKHSKI